MSSRTISGIDVVFPFESPYPAQLMVASKVLNALQKKQHALIESPTGTGKSLALLCSVLSYQQWCQSVMVPPKSSSKDKQSHIPTIYYTSRTHTQLQQVIKEMTRTIYRPKMTILGSREQLCINKPKPSANVSVDDNCNKHLEKKTCKYFNQSSFRIRGMVDRTVFDIEDLCKLGRSSCSCPYFAARSLLRAPGNAKLVFLPYNYIIDPTIRRSLALNLTNAVIIFDEAHNIEAVARDAASRTWRSAQLHVAIDQLNDVPDSDAIRSPLRGMLTYIEASAAIATPQTTFGTDSSVFAGEQMLVQLLEHDMSPTDVPPMRKAIDELTAHFREENDEQAGVDESTGDDENVDMTMSQRQRRNNGGDRVQSSRVLSALRVADSLCTSLELLYQNESSVKHFRLVTTRSPDDMLQWLYEVSLWCLSPAVVMHEIATLASTIIVASGTLFPLDTFAAEVS